MKTLTQLTVFFCLFLLTACATSVSTGGQQPDHQAPDTTITSGPEGTISNADVTFGFACNEEACSFVCQMDDAAVQACNSPTTYSGLADGAHLFAVTAIDAALNEDPSPATRAFTVATTAPDVTPPNTTILSGPSGTIHNADVSFSFACDEGDCTFECKRDDSNYLTCVSPNSWTALADGAHSFEVRATDKAGNTDASPARRDFVVDTSVPDTTPPETTIDSGPAGTTSSTTAIFGFSCSEGTCTFWCRLNSGSWSLCSSPQQYTALTDSTYTFAVTAVDAAGNADATAAIWNWTVNSNQPPQIMFASVLLPDGTAMPVGGQITAASALTFSTLVTDPEEGDLSAATQWLVDGNATGVMGASFVYDASTLVTGSHTVIASVSDSKGASAVTSFAFSVTDCPVGIRTQILTSNESSGSAKVVVFRGCPPKNGDTLFTGSEYNGTDAKGHLFDVASVQPFPSTGGVTVSGVVNGVRTITPAVPGQNLVIGALNFSSGAVLRIFTSIAGDSFQNVLIRGSITGVGTGNSLWIKASRQVSIMLSLQNPIIEIGTTKFTKTNVNANLDLSVIIHGKTMP